MNNILSQKLNFIFSDFSKMRPFWKNFFQEESEQKYWKDLHQNLIKAYEKAYSNHIKIFPAIDNIFKIFEICDLNEVKCCILGQDVYHGAGQAHGLAFSVQKSVLIPPSLKNIYKELKDDIGMQIPLHGCLESWVTQGVFLLNSILTVEEGRAGSHKDLGWQTLTDHVVAELNKQKNPIAFLLWGNFARQKKNLLSSSHHLILETVHPSPLSAHQGFFGCKHFSKTNSFLVENNIFEIDWRII